MKDILIVVDMQNDFIDGVLGTPEAVSILPLIKKRVKEFDGEIIFTRDTHGDDYMETQEGKNLPVPHCIKGTHGHGIHESLLPYTKCVIDKPTFGSFSLAELLKANEKEIASITLVGVCTDICVISNAMLIKAALPEVKITVEAALCAGVTPKSHDNALSAMRACQISVV